MRVMLDNEQWEVKGVQSLGEVLAEVSDRAYARNRVVTTLAIDGRPMTDRDLTPALLAQATTDVVTVQATSRTIRELAETAREPIKKFAAILTQEGEMLVRALRGGSGDLTALDRWLGKLADHVELVERVRSVEVGLAAGTSLATVAARLLDARTSGDMVRLADVLEYELLPSLMGKA